MAGNALEFAHIQFGYGYDGKVAPKSLMQLSEQAQMLSSSRSGRILLESIELKIGENIVHIFDGELDYYDLNERYHDGPYELTLHLMNKVDPRKWFEIQIYGTHDWGIFTDISGFSFSAIQVGFLN